MKLFRNRRPNKNDVKYPFRGCDNPQYIADRFEIVAQDEVVAKYDYDYGDDESSNQYFEVVDLYTGNLYFLYVDRREYRVAYPDEYRLVMPDRYIMIHNFLKNLHEVYILPYGNQDPIDFTLQGPVDADAEKLTEILRGDPSTYDGTPPLASLLKATPDDMKLAMDLSKRSQQLHEELHEELHQLRRKGS